MNINKALYLIMEANYLKVNNCDLNEKNNKMFPHDWYLCDDYDLKSKILYEAINKKLTIIETDTYKNDFIKKI